MSWHHWHLKNNGLRSYCTEQFTVITYVDGKDGNCLKKIPQICDGLLSLIKSIWSLLVLQEYCVYSVLVKAFSNDDNAVLT